MSKNTLKIKLLVPIISALILTGCATSSPTISSGNVAYGDSDGVETLTNEFGSTDLQSIAEKMASSLINTPMLSSGRKPLITLAGIKNRTSEYIDTKSITESIRSKMMTSGRVRFVADKDGMQNQVDELVRQNQTGLYKRSKRSRMGQMQGAKYRIEGSISSIVKRSGNIKDVFYKFSLLLIDNESGVMEWADEKEIRKTSVKPTW